MNKAISVTVSGMVLGEDAQECKRDGLTTPLAVHVLGGQSCGHLGVENSSFQLDLPCSKR